MVSSEDLVRIAMERAVRAGADKHLSTACTGARYRVTAELLVDSHEFQGATPDAGLDLVMRFTDSTPEKSGRGIWHYGAPVILRVHSDEAGLLGYAVVLLPNPDEDGGADMLIDDQAGSVLHRHIKVEPRQADDRSREGYQRAALHRSADLVLNLAIQDLVTYHQEALNTFAQLVEPEQLLEEFARA